NDEFFLNCLDRLKQKGYGKGSDRSDELQRYLLAAKQGDAEAQYQLGVMYEYGRGVERDYEKSLEWFTKSAEQGNMKAQGELGGKYKSGRGVECDIEKAVYWYIKSAEQGNEFYCDFIAEDLLNLGRAEEALPWAIKAVEYEKNNYKEVDYHVYGLLGSVYEALGRYDEALEQYELCKAAIERSGGDSYYDVDDIEDMIEAVKEKM
ncbi:MAG: SEL1-like repeat protein, partial [Prevotellaceae bacterium]|nr:SEL1-like repeat protein [Prevotellaceae bacterium]